MLPLIGAAIAGGLVSGLFGRSGDRAARLAQQQANEQNAAAQREFAQMGIRWKVEDAKAAGLHPLYALGGSGASFSPSFQVSGREGNWQRQMGQDLSRAASAVESSGEAREREARILALNAAAGKDYALAQAASSVTARDRAAQGSFYSDPELMADHVRFLGGAGDPSAARSFPVSGGGPGGTPTPLPPLSAPVPGYLTKDVLPGFTRFNIPALGEVILPAANSASEAIEAMENPIIQSAIFAANVAHYGPEAGRRFVKWLDSQRRKQ